MMLPSVLWILSLMWLELPVKVWSHARLMSPPSRSSMWRLGFPTKKNFNDNALYCGGIQIQWKKNNGKCGICGDAYDTPYPRDNEAGGKYGQGIISMQYLAGQILEAVVDVTTNHRGYFEFKLCPNNNPKKEASQECLDKYTLKLADGSDTKYYIADKGNGDIKVQLQLPKGLTCSQCVFQWTYVAGNNWGRCDDGESRLGCGPQETFRGCADIAIGKNTGIFSHRPSQNDIRGLTNTNSFYKSTKQKYFKDTSISKYPKYALEASKQNSNNKGLNTPKPYSWLISGGSSSVSEQSSIETTSPNRTTSQGRAQPSWDSLHRYFENWQGAADSPTAEEIFLGKSGTEHDLFSAEEAAKLVDSSELFQRDGDDIEFLRFYLHGSEPSTVAERKTTDSHDGFNLGGQRYKEFWFL